MAMVAAQEQIGFSKAAARGSREAEDVASDPSTTELCSEEDSSSEDSDLDDGEDLAPFCREDTILIFDWDDTVMPSTWLSEQRLRLDEGSVLSGEQQATLQRLADSASRTLTAAKRYGKVVLVTNAEQGWIQLSCRKFMPSLLPSLEDVKVLSARSTYEQQGVLSPFEWKFLAFESEIGAFCRPERSEAFLAAGADEARRKNVLSFGDSAHEREALIRVTENLQNCCTKSLKFVERPEVEQLLKEHELISSCFRHIVNHDGNLDLCIRCP